MRPIPSIGVMCTPMGINQTIQDPHPYISGLINKSKEVKENKYKKDSKALLSRVLILLEDLVRLEEAPEVLAWEMAKEGIVQLFNNVYINGLSLNVYIKYPTTDDIENLTIEYHISLDTLYIDLRNAQIGIGKVEPLDVLVEDASKDEPEIVSELKRYFNILAGKGKLTGSNMPITDRLLQRRQEEHMRQASMQAQGMYPNRRN